MKKYKLFLLGRSNIYKRDIMNPLLQSMDLFCIFIFAFLLFHFSVKNALYLDIFTSRDILRAIGWLEGKPYWPGPEMSAGNNLPGPFFYFLLFPALLFGNNIYASSVL